MEPVESAAPNSSRRSSVVSRRETRFLTARVATAACRRGPKAPGGTPAGSSARVTAPHSGQRRRCPECGAVTRAELPAGVPPGAFGARLQAAVATLAVRNRVSRRDTTELLRELFGAELSSGSIDAIVQRVARALDEPYEDLLGHVRAASALNVD